MNLQFCNNHFEYLALKNVTKPQKSPWSEWQFSHILKLISRKIINQIMERWRFKTIMHLEPIWTYLSPLKLIRDYLSPFEPNWARFWKVMFRLELTVLNSIFHLSGQILKLPRPEPPKPPTPEPPIDKDCVDLSNNFVRVNIKVSLKNLDQFLINSTSNF